MVTAMSEPQSGQAFRRKRRAKNWAMLAALVAFVVIIYFVAIIRMGGG